MINWFPGHMNKARRELAERVKKSDLVIELLDARMPRASENPMLERIRGLLPCIKLLTKTDLADRSVTARWKMHLEREGVDVEDVVATEPKLGARLARASQRAVPQRGKPGFPVRAMIVGIPNVGKSTLFNTLLGKSKAEVRNKPAITRREQQAMVGNDLVIIDTPGVLWPKLEDQRAAHCLAAAGSISEAAFDPVEVSCFLIDVLRKRYRVAFTERYKLDVDALESPMQAKTLLEEIGRRRGCLVRGGSVDLNKAASILLTDVRSSKLGPLSLETPDDYQEREGSATPEPAPEN